MAVIIPCYNEAVTIGKVVDDFRRVLPEAAVYVYDNNSSDGTGDIARAHGAIVKVERRQGKGNVVRQMMRDIDADAYLMVDGDDTYPAEAAPALLAPLFADEADMVVGDRLSNGTYGEENDRAFHGFGNDLVRVLIKWIYGFEFSDVMTGYRAYNKVFAKTMPVLSPGFEIETELSIHAVDKRWRIAEVPIDYRDRPEGSESKLSTFSDGFKVLMMIMSLFKDYKPLALFSWVALLFVVLGLVAGVPVIARAIQGNVHPTAFFWKIVFTALTLEAGFKGGEIVPSFFVGATFGCLFGQIAGISPSLCAGVGMVSVFCGVTNCPISSLLISFELFGYDAVPYFMIAISVSFLLSGYYGLYHDQTIVYSKYRSQYVNRKARD